MLFVNFEKAFNAIDHDLPLRKLALCELSSNILHLLSSPPPPKSMVITTRQKHQLSDLSLRLTLDGQNIENVTEHHLLGLIVDNKLPRSNTYPKACQKKFLLSQLHHIINFERLLATVHVWDQLVLITGHKHRRTYFSV